MRNPEDTEENMRGNTHTVYNSRSGSNPGLCGAVSFVVDLMGILCLEWTVVRINKV